MIYIFKIIGALGIVLISMGVISKGRKKQNIFYILGGGCLEIYSLYLGDIIFIVLQMIFIFSAIYDFNKLRSYK